MEVKKVRRKTKVTADMDLYNGKLSLKEKIFYSFGELGQNFALQMIMAFLSVYLTDVALIPAATLGAFIIIVKLLDSFTDILAGITVDSIHFKFAEKWKNGGKFRPLLLVYTPISALLFVLVFCIPTNVSVVVKLTWYAVVTVVNGYFFSVVNISAMGLMSRMTQNPKERNALSAIMGMFIMASVIVVTSVVPMINKMIGDQATGFRVSAIIFNILFVIFTYIQVIFSKERVQVNDEKENNDKKQMKKKYTFKEAIKIIIANKALMAFFLTSVCSAVANAVLQGGTVYYLKYYMNDFNLTKYGLMSALSGATIFPAIVLAPFIANKIGKKKTYIFALFLMSLLSLSKLFIPRGDMTTFLAIVPFTGIGTGLFLSLGASVASDSQEYGEWTTGKRTEGIVASISSSLKKIMTSFAGAIPLFVLGLSGYVANQKEQPENVLNGILSVNVYIPALLFLIGALVMVFLHPLDKKTLNTMLVELKERRESKQ